MLLVSVHLYLDKTKQNGNQNRTEIKTTNKQTNRNQTNKKDIY